MRLALTLGLDGIGSTGNSTNRNAFAFSIKNPRHPTIPVTVYLHSNDSADTLMFTKIGSVTYQASPGSELFTGTIDLNGVSLNTNYKVRVMVDGHLQRKLIETPAFTSANQTITASRVNMIAGDINGDNNLTIDDYTILISCSTLSSNPGACTEANRLLADLNDNGAIDTADTQLWRQELYTKEGE